MTGLEAASIALGTALAKTACGIWLGEDRRLAASTADAVIDLATGRLGTVKHRRQFQRLLEQAAELVAEQIQPLVEREFRSLPEHERLAAIRAVEQTLAQATLTEADLYARDLDAAYLDRHVRARVPNAAADALLSEAATALYDLLLRSCCGYLIEIVQTLPRAGIMALAEVLRRESQVLAELAMLLGRMPIRRDVHDFEADYRQLIRTKLDRIQISGVTLPERIRRYPLSIAYMSLTLTGDFTPRRQEAGRYLEEPAAVSTSLTARADQVLEMSRRIFIRGYAGSGKTTLLDWVAVQTANQEFPSNAESRDRYRLSSPFAGTPPKNCRRRSAFSLKSVAT